MCLDQEIAICAPVLSSRRNATHVAAPRSDPARLPALPGNDHQGRGSERNKDARRIGHERYLHACRGEPRETEAQQDAPNTDEQ
jgi:hypothetical protein